MKERLIFAFIAGLIGCAVGSGLAFLLQKEGEPFPSFIVVAVTVIFAACGALGKREWVDAVWDFFHRVLP